MPRDSQRSKEYGWEFALERAFDVCHLAKVKKLTFAECKALGEVIWLDMTGGHEYSEGHRTKPPRIKMAHGRRRASCFRHFPPTIEITTWGHNPMTILHETAHAILSASEWKLPVTFLPAHGPHFVTLAMRIYERYMGFDRETMESMARTRRLKFVSDEELDAFLNREPTNNSEATTVGA